MTSRDSADAMHVRLLFDMAAIVLACQLCAGAAIAQSYPNKPIRLIAPEPGANGDLVARLIAQGIAPTLSQPVIVDNRPSNLIGEVVGKAPADGYTLGLGAGAIWLT